MNTKEALKNLKASGKGVAVSVVVYVLVLLFKPSLIILLSCLVAALTAHYLYSTLYKKKKVFSFLELTKKILSTITIVLIVYALYYFTGSWGLWSTLLVVLVLSLIILIKRRKAYLEALRHIETMIFKKSLDKENFTRLKK